MVFVLGAGASMPYGYPLAGDLVEDIAYDQLPQQSALLGNQAFHELQENLKTSKAQSIDIFLGRDSQKAFEEVGRWAIAEKLMQCEARGNIFGKSKGYKDKIRIDDDWYAYLFNTLTFGIRDLDAVANLPVSFITFNYDRSLEYFLHHYLPSNFPRQKGVEDVIKALDIHHVYGHLEPLEFEDKPGGRAYSATTINSTTVKKAAEGIRVLHQGGEHEDTKKVLQLAADRMAKADAILFLGFGYHPENMARLQVPFDRLGGRTKDSPVKQIQQIWGTIFNMTDSESQGIKVMYDPRREMAFAHRDHKITEALRNNPVFLRLVQ